MLAVIEELEESEGSKTPEPLRSNLLETDVEMFALMKKLGSNGAILTWWQQVLQFQL
jgi:hypothetical protein